VRSDLVPVPDIFSSAGDAGVKFESCATAPLNCAIKRATNEMDDARYEKDLRGLIKRIEVVRDEAARVGRGKNGQFSGFWDEKVLHIKKNYAKVLEIHDETSENKKKGQRGVEDILLDQLKHKLLTECQELLVSMASEQKKNKKKVSCSFTKQVHILVDRSFYQSLPSNPIFF
jgi:hypothetical protein